MSRRRFLRLRSVPLAVLAVAVSFGGWGQTGPEFPGAIWVPARYSQSGRHCGAGNAACQAPQYQADFKIEYIVLFATEGSSAEGAVADAQLQKSPDRVTSAHYIIANGKGPRYKDGQIIQMVHEADTAWTLGIWPVKSAGAHRGPVNNFNTISIELAGRSDQKGWCTERMYQSAARLVAFLADSYGIPISRERILGHDEAARSCTPPLAGRVDPCGGKAGQCTFDWNHFMALVAEAAVGPSLPSPGFDLSRGLVAWYPFDGSLDDRSGNGNDGIPGGAVSFTAGRLGQALKLSGISDAGYVGVLNGDSLSLGAQLTLSFHLRVDGAVGEADRGGGPAVGAPQCVLAKSGAGSGFWLNVYLYPAQTQAETVFGVRYITGPEPRLSSRVRYSQGSWVHVAVTYDAGESREYIDGAETAHTLLAPATLAAANSEDLYIGAQKGDATLFGKAWLYPLDGAIDDLRVYNRVLSTDELQALANSAPPTSAVTSAPVPSATTPSETAAVPSVPPAAVGGTPPWVWPVVIGGVVVIALALVLVRVLGG